MYAAEKENTLDQQSTPDLWSKAPVANAKKTTARKGKKRTLTVNNDLEINLNGSVPATTEIVEAMRKRILELEDQLEGHAPSKRAKVTKAPEEEPASSARTSSGAEVTKTTFAKLDSKKIDAILKKIWSSLQKEVKTEKYKFSYGAPKTCRIEEVIEKEEFTAIFNHVGQWSSDNKPNSVVCKREYTVEDIEKLFGKHFKELKGYRYNPGGPFMKAEKLGLGPLKFINLQVSYSYNTMKCTMKFEVAEANPDEESCRPRSRYVWVRAGTGLIL